MYVRKIKKEGKTYLYYYKSQRIGNKVKSIYIGRALEKPKKYLKNKSTSVEPLKNKELVNNLLEFDNLLFEISKHISTKDLKNSINVYHKMMDIYSKLDLQHEDKQRIFDRLSSTYNELVNLSKEHNINLE